MILCSICKGKEASGDVFLNGEETKRFYDVCDLCFDEILMAVEEIYGRYNNTQR